MTFNHLLFAAFMLLIVPSAIAFHKIPPRLLGIRKDHTPVLSLRRNNVPSKALSDSVSILLEKLEAPPEVIISAVERAPAKGRLSVSDAATLAGVDLVTARKGLMTLASLTGAVLDVTNDGDIVYSFPDNFRAILQQRSLGQQLKSVYDTLFPFLLFTARASFGVALLTSLAILASTFIFLSSSASVNGDGDRKNGERSNSYNRNSRPFGGYGYSLSRGLFDGVFDYFYYRPTFGYYSTGNYSPRFDGSDFLSSGNDLSFIESFFSYVFGDGNPNTGFTNAQLSAIALKIRENNGVVIAEQLAPYLDSPPALPSDDAENESTIVDESWVLPAVLQLGGNPMATPEGDIVYTFQDVVTTAMEKELPTASTSNLRPPTIFENIFGSPPLSTTPSTSLAPSALQELRTPFSAAATWQQWLAGGLGALNLFGVFKLGELLATPIIFRGEPLLYGALSKLYPFLFGYAIMYNAIPMIRWLLLQRRNQGVEKRNERRKIWSYILSAVENSAAGDKLRGAGPAVGTIANRLKEKIRNARAFGSSAARPKVIGRPGDIIYSTGDGYRDDAASAASAKEEDLLRKFDEKLGL